MKVSIVIPTLNAGPGFDDLLRGISGQEGNFGTEIVVVDSGSTDGTAELAERYGATVIRIPASEFDHGATRNLGISRASGEYVALTVQDAVPLDGRWLAAMVENLERDDRVAVVYSRHVPRAGAGPLTRVLLGRLDAASTERRVQEIRSPEEYRAMSPIERRLLAAFDNVSSCLRRSVWDEFPFEKTNFGEDLRWGKRAIEAGYRLVYEPRSAVIHSHERGPLYDLRRHYVDQLVIAELFDARLVPDMPRLILSTLLSAHRVYRLLENENPGGGLRNLLLALRHALPAQLGAYLGCKVPSVARLHPALHAELHRHLSRGV